MAKTPERFEYNSIQDKLRREKKTSPEFEVMLATLTLEEIIGLRLEMAAKSTNKKLYGFKVYNALPFIAKEAVLMYAYMNCRTEMEASTFIGVDSLTYYSLIMSFGIQEKAAKRLDKEK